MSAQNASEAWFPYFKDNYLWSQLIGVVLNLAPMGGSAMWEVDRVGKRLQGKEGDSKAWVEEWERMADFVLAAAGEEEKKGHRRTAAGAYVRSSVYRYVSERQIHPDDPRKKAAYRQVTDHFERGMRGLIPGFERVEVPYEEGPLPAFWIPPAYGAEKAPAVVFFDGFDVSKESTALWGGLALRERGVGVLCIDGPGQGEALRLNGIPSRHDYEVPAGAAFDYLSARPDVDPDRIGLMAISMGGYYAPRAAAFEHRFAACVAWGAHYDFHDVWSKRATLLQSGGTVAASALWQLAWVMGTPDLESGLKKAEDYKLADVAGNIKMPFLIIHGENDALQPVEIARTLFDAVGSTEKELKIFTAETGGCQHCGVDNLLMAGNWAADWWMDRFGTGS
jgi:dipeptidyl aminopeptidase/acylaminoacyl peptidase